MGTRRRSGAALLVLSFVAAGIFGQTPHTEAARLLQEGRYEAARASALQALSRDGSDTEASLVLCQSLLLLGRPADAENYALKAYAQRRDPRFSSLLGEATFALGKNRDALGYFQAYVSAFPEGSQTGSAYYYMGEIYLRQARYGHADIAFTAALQYSPGNARWWSRLGWAQEKAGEVSQALLAYEEALRLEPSLEDARLGAERVKGRIRG